MARAEPVCRLRVMGTEDKEDANEDPQEASIIPLKDCPDLGTELRTRWANEVMEHFGETKEPHTSIRSWDFVAGLDGTVKSIPMPRLEGDLIDGYPARFQIPPSILDGLDQEEKVRRAERFAMASLLYEIMTGKEPYEDLSDEEVRQHFSGGEFPDDTATLPNVLFILSGWSAEFSQELAKQMERQNVTYIQSVKDYARAHPVLTGIQAVGVGISVLSLCAPLALGAIGFSAAGPVAGSTATAWQASIGAVKAGSLFSWCQSAAMGGGALGGIQAAGVAGAAGAALTRVGDLPELMQTFKRGFGRRDKL